MVHDDNIRGIEEEKGRGIWARLAVVLGLTVIIASFLDWQFGGVPLNLIIPLLDEPATLSRIIYYSIIIAMAVYIGYVGLRELIIEKRFSVEFLMAVAALGAAYLGFLFEAATVLFFYSLAEYFEGYIQDRARKTVEKLTRFMPDKARVTVDNSEKNLDVREIHPGMVLLVRPGERIALDGEVVEGYSSVDQSLVTGESVPLFRKSGDNVYAGTLNLSGVLKVAVTKSAEDTLVSRIVKLVIESRKSKASIERLVDRFARFYVPAVIVLALIAALFGPSLAGGSFETWLYRSMMLLVISCPSAFLVSVPATLFTAVTAAARRGVIIKGGIYIEKLAEVKAVIFDKTGTLTLGRPAVHEVKVVEEADEQALMYAAALEQFSNHPLAQAVVKKASDQKLDFAKLETKDIMEIPGKGIVGYVNGVHVIVGNMELLEDYKCNCEQISEIYPNDRHSSVCVSIGKEATAAICVVDALREDAVKAIESLKKARIHTAMLTGDRSDIAGDVAESLGIDEFHAELFPEDKLKIVDEIKKKYRLVAMVGDGVNDAPALAASDVGIAMGGVGVDAALESADIVLVKDELIQIPYLRKLSIETVKVARQNIVASIAIKIMLAVLGLFGLIPLWFAVASGDDGLTMLVLLNTLRLTKIRTEE